MVETAIVIVLFLTLIFAIIEFSFALLRWGQAIEATRAGVRFAIVNDPVYPDLFADLSCPGGTAVVADCGDAGAGIDCGPAYDPEKWPAEGDGVLARMQRVLSSVEASNIRVTYACTDAGYMERPLPVPSVTVEITGLQHTLIVPTLLGFDATWTVPRYASTRTGEDLHTVVPP
ncbi:MAG: hypothetical protein B0D96_12390 [Candidatus Sedimenticola endophacoides]|uniref:TadE-like domain-containing protein n=1 Tax=Candidatus Sedimenticola endophacoides TaxID=2548426 RepID=A0A657Q4J3_9GAMM|nr:MAG: hypothetical protein B0D94_02675 [Candidatus Sedimenticola endophacoides]OQX33021.1 MAG: hypothetical protein B0D96_12390 [Candidatus Sedimenticola endophacoides]OQX41226.1 MAG: hypothetical protein B0D88_07935 [Candidatus Sedimenticola endophacoides]OQX42564.1 MAG: hypothetical protein B0D89_01020 [Candidatus Sedimenticola endophacoides]OQX47893.1 MAG: hypothetical protein B0D87_08340 [Candidatus Sedimenticola endophacoides]